VNHLELDARVDPRTGYPGDHEADNPPANALMGQLGSISPPHLHPAYFDYKVAQTIASRDRRKAKASSDTLEGTSEEGESRPRAGSGNELFDLSFNDISLSISRRNSGVLYRGVNPLGHTGESENYFVVYERALAWDFKRNAAYAPLTYLLVEAGIRDSDSP
jgi:hypothetical protein